MSKPKPINITQSLIKSVEKYLEKQECGLIIKAKYYDGVSFPSTDAMKYGIYFEYILTGALPKDKKKPVAEYTKSGELRAKYKLMHEQADHFKRAMDYYGLEIIESGITWEKDGISGTLDILAKATKDIEIKDNDGDVVKVISSGSKVIIDLKTSGLLENKYDSMGWHFDTLQHKDNLTIQPVHYKLLGRMIYGEDIPFVFFIHSNTNNVDRKIIEVSVSESRFEYHQKTIESTRKFMELETEWTPYPDVKRCSDCGLFKYCEYKVTVPEIQQVVLE